MSAPPLTSDPLLALALQTLETLSGVGSTVDRLRRILALIRETLDIEVAGVRLETDDTSATVLIDGPPPEPLPGPQSGPGTTLQPFCPCQWVRRRSTGTDSAELTARGSYWTANGIAGAAPQADSGPANGCSDDCLCRRRAWQSLAVIPIEVDTGRIAGLLQLLDSRPGRLSSETVAAVEKASAALGVCLQMDQLNSELRRYRFESAENQPFDGQSLQSQKLEAVGTLAGGIAHDFNNILWIIAGNNELALNNLPGDHPVRENLLRVEEACQRAKDLITQILSFSRPADQAFKPLRISSVVRESLKLLRSSLPSTIEIRTVISAETDLVQADLPQINQALLNLYTNAAEAMRETGGVLEVSLVAMDLSDTEARQHENLAPGRYAVLSVADTGTGIEPAIVRRIFDPYFSARKAPGGLGMGLAVVRGIVKNHGGAIRVQSEPGRGATFHVFLPCLPNPVDDAAPRIDETQTLPRGHSKVLWVDDEPGVLEMGRQMLSQLGYDVTTCDSSQKALELFKADPDHFDVIVTDQTMPQLTGQELARQMLAIRADTAIILCTGYSEQFTEADARAMGIREYLLKPLNLRFLAQTVKRVSQPAA